MSYSTGAECSQRKRNDIRLRIMAALHKTYIVKYYGNSGHISTSKFLVGRRVKIVPIETYESMVEQLQECRE